jgi:hypothetical protein
LHQAAIPRAVIIAAFAELNDSKHNHSQAAEHGEEGVQRELGGSHREKIRQFHHAKWTVI